MNAIEELKKLTLAGLDDRAASAIVELVARHNDELVTKDYLDAALGRFSGEVDKRFVSVEKQLAELKGKMTILLMLIPFCTAVICLVLGWILTHSKFTG